jgi:hypothetical protein
LNSFFTEPPRCCGTREKLVDYGNCGCEKCEAVLVSGSGTLMTFLNAYDDFMQSVGAFVSPLEKLEYLNSLRDEGGCISHWGLEKVHGIDAARSAYDQAANIIWAELMRTPLENLWQVATRPAPYQSVTDRLHGLHTAFGNLRIAAREKIAHLRFIESALAELGSSIPQGQK